MRIALDGRTIQDHFPGIGRYTFNLALALADVGAGDEIVLLHNTREYNTRFDIGLLRARANISMVEANSPYFSPVEQWRIPRKLRANGVVLYHSPYYMMPYLVPCTTVVTIHDLIPLMYPQYFSKAQLLVFNATVRLAAHAARIVVADSEATAADLQRLLHLSASKVRVVLAAADPTLARASEADIASVRIKYNLTKPYVLYVGSNKPHKNLIRLVEAWARVPSRARSQLVIAGAWNPAYNTPKLAAGRLGVEGSIGWLNAIPPADLSALYSGATVFVFPSEYEGFGLPVLEAMACGVPVICSNRSSLSEIAANAAILVDPGSSAAWAEYIERFLTEEALRTDYARRSLARAQAFNWTESARRMRSVYEEAIELW